MHMKCEGVLDIVTLDEVAEISLLCHVERSANYKLVLLPLAL